MQSKVSGGNEAVKPCKRYAFSQLNMLEDAMKRRVRVVRGERERGRGKQIEYEDMCRLTSAGLTIEPLRMGSDNKQRIGTAEPLTQGEMAMTLALTIER